MGVLPIVMMLMLAQASTTSAPGQRVDAKSDKAASGFYEITPMSGTNSGTRKYVYISQTDGELVLKDLKTSAQATGLQRPDGSVVFHQGRAPASTGEELLLNGWPTDGMEGTFTMTSGERTSIRAVKLVSVWACGNHETAHMAKSEKEMQDASLQYSCTGWHKVQAPK